jgi:hypothetical protein
VVIRCLIDGLLLPACVVWDPRPPGVPALWAYDGDEGFALEAVEALYYEIVSATPAELLAVERARFRLLRRAEDFVAAAT